MSCPVSHGSPLPRGQQAQTWVGFCPLACVCFLGTPIPSEVTARDLPLVQGCLWGHRAVFSSLKGVLRQPTHSGVGKGQNLLQVNKTPLPTPKLPEVLQITKQIFELLKGLLLSFKLYFENNTVRCAEGRKGQ